jgi:hypothetical protein
MHTRKWYKLFRQLNATAVSANTWSKYSSALNKMKKYCAIFLTKLTWPLKTTVLQGFMLWCLESETLAPATVRTYISAISHIQQIYGFPPIQVASTSFSYLLIGAQIKRTGRYTQKPRDPVTFPRLKYIKQTIFKSKWSAFNKQAIWTLCTVAFFGAFRLGELLAKTKTTFDKTTTLLTKHISFQQNTNAWTIWIRQPKSKNPQGETVFLFPFNNTQFCPVNAMCTYIQLLQNCSLYHPDMPVFRFQSGRNITIKTVNALLAKLFPVALGYKVTGHSFRAGLVSSAANYPDIINDPHVQGWGRWKSNAFLRYQHFDTAQKQWIFNKLTQTLGPDQ